MKSNYYIIVRHKYDMPLTTTAVPGQSGNQYYVKNHLGSTMFLTDDKGSAVIAPADYFPYGKRVSLTEMPEVVTQTFTGKELDRYDEDMDEGEDGEGWYYFGARYLDPDVGVWMSCDPSKQFYDLYAYTGNGYNPVNGVDADGKRYRWSFQYDDATKIKSLLANAPAIVKNAYYYVDTDPNFIVDATLGISDQVSVPYFFYPVSEKEHILFSNADNFEEEVLHAYLYYMYYYKKYGGMSKYKGQIDGEEAGIDVILGTKGNPKLPNMPPGSEIELSEGREGGILQFIQSMITVHRLKKLNNE